MGELLPWLLAATALCLLVGWQLRRRRADGRRARAIEPQRSEEQAERERLAAAEAERAAAALTEHQRLAAEQAQLEAQRLAVEHAQREAQRVAAEKARHEAQYIAAEQEQARRQAALRAEQQRIEAQAERERLVAAEAERAAAALAERERLAAEQAHIEAQRLAAERAQREAQRVAAEQGEARRQAGLRAEQRRLAAELAETERLETERAQAEPAEAERRAAEAAREAQRLAEQMAASVAPPRAAKSAAQTLVLVADDSKVVRIKTGRLLAQHQYRVAYAGDGLEALQQLRTDLPDVLITDVEMPGMDGFELTRHIRGDARTARLPVIMITAADERHREQADAAGVSVLLGKPYAEDELLAHIRRAMGQHVDERSKSAALA